MMKKLLAVVLIIASLLFLVACGGAAAEVSGTVSESPEESPSTVPSATPSAEPSAQASGQIYLYGEAHGVEKILNRELELWSGYYHDEGMRHLFIEFPHYTAEFLNIWMQADNDDILEEVYQDWVGSAAYVPCEKEFFQNIKSECPETVFHGTDVGHQHDTIGERYLRYLEQNNMTESENYRIALETIEQGKFFISRQNHVYRENAMVQNFIREFDKLDGESVMGIYGAAHTGLDDMDFTNTIPSMANQLKEQYGEAVHSEDISWLALVTEPLRTDSINVAGKDYEASYFGEENIAAWSEIYNSREFWRLENAYEDFKDMPKTGNVLPYNNYPMPVETEQVFVIDYVKKDGSDERQYLRSDGYVWEGQPSTERFIPEETGDADNTRP